MAATTGHVTRAGHAGPAPDARRPSPSLGRVNTRLPPLPLAPPPQHVPGVLRHLRRLTQSFVQEGQRVAYLHVYARPLAPGRDPPLAFITAQESGSEGIACVDDAARA